MRAAAACLAAGARCLLPPRDTGAQALRVQVRDAAVRRPFATHEPESFSAHGYVRGSGAEAEFAAPDERVLLCATMSACTSRRVGTTGPA